MATINSERQGGLSASVDCTLKQYTLAILTGKRTVGPCATAGAICIGVIGNKPNVGQAAEILVGPEVKVVLGATLAPGAKFAASATGTAVAPATTNNILGQLVEGGVAGEIVAAIFEPQGLAP